MYLFATRAAAKAKYALALLNPLPLPPPKETKVDDGLSVDTRPPEGDGEGDRLANECSVFYVCHGSTKCFSSPSEGSSFIALLSLLFLWIV